MTTRYETANQRARRRIGANLRGTWPNERPLRNRQPRGLVNRHSCCYRLATLQMLAHLPKFVNWIMQHNVEGQNWPCRAEDPNRSLPPLQTKDQALLGMNQKLIVGCVTCRLKQFFATYWGATDLNSNGVPRAFGYNHDSIETLHGLCERWNCVLPSTKRWQGKRKDESDEDFAARRLKNETPSERAARVNHARGQHDSTEFMDHIFRGIENSIGPDDRARFGQYEALFTLQRHEESTCTKCQHVHDRKAGQQYTDTRDTGFSNMLFKATGTDRLADAISRSKLHSEIEKLTCGNTECGHVDAEWSRRIEAAPHYLRIHLDMSRIVDGVGLDGKNRRPLEIPEILDLTRHAYMPAEEGHAKNEPYPLRYKLISALHHEGFSADQGHWTAGVSCPAPSATEENQHKKAVEVKRAEEAGEAKIDKAKVTKPTPAPAVPRPEMLFNFCNDSIITPQFRNATTTANPLTQNPYPIPPSSLYPGNVNVMMYERIYLPPVRRITAELKDELNEDGYWGSRKKNDSKKDDSKKDDSKKDDSKKDGGTEDDGTKDDSKQDDGTKDDSKQDDSKKDDSKKDDGKKDDGKKDGGTKDGGTKEDGAKDDSIKDDSIKDDGTKHDSTKNEIVDEATKQKRKREQDYAEGTAKGLKRSKRIRDQ